VCPFWSGSLPILELELVHFAIGACPVWSWSLLILELEPDEFRVGACPFWSCSLHILEIEPVHFEVGACPFCSWNLPICGTLCITLDMQMVESADKLDHVEAKSLRISGQMCLSCGLR